jgi:hypothetical protein
MLLLLRTDVSEESTAAIIRGIVFLHSMLQLLATANVVPSSPILIILMMEAIHSSEMSILARAS